MTINKSLRGWAANFLGMTMSNSQLYGSVDTTMSAITTQIRGIPTINKSSFFFSIFYFLKESPKAPARIFAANILG